MRSSGRGGTRVTLRVREPPSRDQPAGGVARAAHHLCLRLGRLHEEHVRPRVGVGLRAPEGLVEPVRGARVCPREDQELGGAARLRSHLKRKRWWQRVCGVAFAGGMRARRRRSRRAEEESDGDSGAP